MRHETDDETEKRKITGVAAALLIRAGIKIVCSNNFPAIMGMELFVALEETQTGQSG